MIKFSAVCLSAICGRMLVKRGCQLYMYVWKKHVFREVFWPYHRQLSIKTVTTVYTLARPCTLVIQYFQEFRELVILKYDKNRTVSNVHDWFCPIICDNFIYLQTQLWQLCQQHKTACRKDLHNALSSCSPSIINHQFFVSLLSYYS